MCERSQLGDQAPELNMLQIRLVDRQPLILLVTCQPHGNVLQVIPVQRVLRAEDQLKLQWFLMIVNAEM